MCHVHVFTVFYRYLQHHLESPLQCVFFVDFQYHVKKIITLWLDTNSDMHILHSMTTSYNAYLHET